MESHNKTRNFLKKEGNSFWHKLIAALVKPTNSKSYTEINTLNRPEDIWNSASIVNEEKYSIHDLIDILSYNITYFQGQHLLAMGVNQNDVADWEQKEYPINRNRLAAEMKTLENETGISVKESDTVQLSHSGNSTKIQGSRETLFLGPNNGYVDYGPNKRYYLYRS